MPFSSTRRQSVPVSDVPPPDDNPPELTQPPAGASAIAAIITMIARARRERDVFIMPSCTDPSKRNDIECDNAQPVPLARSLTVDVCVGSSANGGGVMRR
jgi:hypothetical protein